MIGGRYALDREIGRGGMGAVWLGRDEVLGRLVALKRVAIGPEGSDPALERAEREARLAARLNHQHVVAVFDLVDDGDARWLVMEYVEGTDLAALVRSKGALSPDQVAPVLGQVAGALAAAHGAAIVHRDVKPSNILITEDGTAKLTDFGIARTQSDVSVTRTGLVTGSPAYLAPEVAAGRPATAASDMWSWGATAYHALAGHPPYQVDENVLGALYRIVHEDPPRPDGAGWMLPLLEATMTRDPADRWSAETVQAFLEGGPHAARARPPRRLVEAGTLPAVAPAGHPATGTRTPVRPVAPPGARPRRRRRPPLLAVVALVALVVLVSAVAFAVGLGGGTGGTPADTSSSPSPTTATSEPATLKPTAAGMEDFISTYLPLAASDPERAFEMLTPAYQAKSKGLAGYRGFWGQVRSVQLLRVSGDPESLQVTYTYRRQEQRGKPIEETVTLQLAFDDVKGTYLIAGSLSG